HCAKQGLALDKRLSPRVVTVEHKQVKGAGACAFVIGATVQGFKVGYPIRVKPNDLGIKNRRSFDATCGIDSQRVPRTRPSRTWICKRYPSCFNSCTQSGPNGGRLATVG